ncbi:DMT family transporter [Clostridium sp. DJ247]|uniref:DMT family transporter n=1 Tax=Clostridium sp. DJ247 TaxID=2726188 RepID=UPI00162A2F37|nr:DMT family transporter [Clostridium sp. DJ247]MBC2582316.1 DMT family transporter [Clostridium sp. DJ247]
MNIILAVLSGIFLSVMITLNGLLNKSLDVFQVSFIVHAIGMILLVLYIKMAEKQNIKILGGSPILYSAGILGVFLVSVNSFTFNIIGATLTTALSLAGQIIASALIDHFGFFDIKKVHFKILRLPGFIIICIGLFLLIKN